MIKSKNGTNFKDQKLCLPKQKNIITNRSNVEGVFEVIMVEMIARTLSFNSNPIKERVSQRVEAPHVVSALLHVVKTLDHFSPLKKH